MEAFAVLFAAGAAISAWWWSRCYRRGRIYHRGWWSRKDNPFNYWFSMVALATVTVVCVWMTVYVIALVIRGGAET